MSSGVRGVVPETPDWSFFGPIWPILALRGVICGRNTVSGVSKAEKRGCGKAIFDPSEGAKL